MACPSCGEPLEEGQTCDRCATRTPEPAAAPTPVPAEAETGVQTPLPQGPAAPTPMLEPPPVETSSPRPGAPIGLWTACGVALFSAFLPWIAFSVDAVQATGGAPLFAATFSAWSAHVSIAGVVIPHWLLFFMALTIGVFAALRHFSVWTAPPIGDLILVAYAVVHVIVSLATLPLGAHVGIGTVGALASFVAIGVLLVRRWLRSMPKATPTLPIRRRRAAGRKEAGETVAGAA